MGKEYGSWEGIKVRDFSGRAGVVHQDDNGPFERWLTIRFEDGDMQHLVLNNVGPSRPDTLGIEWEFNPGEWARISK